MGVMDVVETKFKGKFARRRESEVRQGSGMKGAEKKGEAKKAAPKPGAKDGGGPRSTNLPDFSLFHMVHIALLSTPDRIYMICLAGPESTTSKFGIYDAKFHDVLNSIRLNFELQAAK